MTLYEMLMTHESVCEDTSDTVFDAVVTIDWERDYSPSYDLKALHDFSINLFKAVNFIEVNKYNVWIIDWSGFIKDNLEKFKQFSKDYWERDISDWSDDDLIYEWINELHYCLAGYATDFIYKEFNERFFS